MSARDPSSTRASLLQSGLVPVLRATSGEEAERIADALVAGGITVLEVTMTVPGAVDVLRLLRRRFRDMVLLGAGTVTDGALVPSLVDAGARFIVMPCFLPAVIEAAHAAAALAVPGALTPTEIHAASLAGATLIKVFPAGSVGGPDYLRAIRGPFPGLSLVPTGGVALDDIGEYFAAGAAAVGVGGELIRRDLVRAGDFSAIAALATRYVDAVRAVRQQAPVRSDRP